MTDPVFKSAKDVEAFLALLVDPSPGTCIEVRALDVVTRPNTRPQTYCGFFLPNQVSQMVSQAFAITKKAKGVYFTINPLKSELLSRRNGTLQYAGKDVPSGDADVVRRRWLFIDFDSVTEVAQISSTDAEKVEAISASVRCQTFLAENGWHDPIRGDSGNGAYLLYSIDLPNDDDARDLLKNVLRALGAKFTTDKVKVDSKVYNAGRIMKFPATLARKGTHSIERPHRTAKPLSIPDSIIPIDAVLLRDIASMAPVERTRKIPSGRVRSVRGSRYTPAERARMFVEACPGTNTGEGDCHSRTLDTANTIVNGFDQPFDVALQIMSEWNEKCSPPWDESDFVHKVEDAIKKGDPQGRPRGWMLSESKGIQGSLAAQSKNPFEPMELDPLAGLGLTAADLPPSGPALVHEIEIGTDEHRVNDAAVKAIAQDPDIYQRGGQLVHVVCEILDSDDDGIRRVAGSPSIRSLPPALVRERLTRYARLFSTSRNKKTGEVSERDEHPPKWCVEAVYHRGTDRHFRRLNGITTSPTLRPDGSVLCDPGYDGLTGLLFVPSGEPLDIPDAPTVDDARDAIETLLDVTVDFPFSSRTHAAAWLALTLTPFARHAFSGPSPLFLIDANTRGTGKSLLADVTARITTGRPASRMSNPSDDDEARKRITSIALKGDPIVLIDNIDGRFGSASLDAALTAVSWQDRILGRSEMITLPLLSTWMGTGNNVILAADTSRRVCHIRLLSPEENPERRTGFHHEHLLQFVAERRAELVRSCLIILRAYFAAGCPRMNLPEWGSYEGWSKIVRNAIVWSGQEDPGATREELAKRSDITAGGIRDLLFAWNTIDTNGEGLTAGALLDLLSRDFNRFEEIRTAISELCGSPAGKLPGPLSLGNKFRTIRERNIGGKCLDARPDRTGRQVWFVRSAGAAEPAEAFSARSHNGSYGSNGSNGEISSHIGGGKTAPSGPAAPADSNSTQIELPGLSGREPLQPLQDGDIWENAAEFPDIDPQ